MKHIATETTTGLVKGQLCTIERVNENGWVIVKEHPASVHINNLLPVSWHGLRPDEMSPRQLGEFIAYRAYGFTFETVNAKRKLEPNPTFSMSHMALSGVANTTYRCPMISNENHQEIKKIRKQMEELAQELKRLENKS